MTEGQIGPRTALAIETQDWSIATYREHILELRVALETATNCTEWKK